MPCIPHAQPYLTLDHPFSAPSQTLALLLARPKPLRPLRLRVLVRIQLGPDFLNVLPLLLRRLAVLPCPLQSQTPQTHVHSVLCVGAVPGYFPQEAAGVAFFERGDDVGAAWEKD